MAEGEEGEGGEEEVEDRGGRAVGLRDLHVVRFKSETVRD